MMKRFPVVVAAACTAAVAAGCPPPETVPDAGVEEQECELDPNFDTTGAQTATLDTPVQGILCPSFDTDFWAFDVAEPGTIVTLTLTMPTAITAVNPAYKIIKDNGTPDGAPLPFSGEDPQKSQGEPTNFTAAHRLEEAGRYYVVVQDARFVENALDITNPYSLTVSLVPDPDGNEPNNSDETATAQAPGTFTGQIATTGDEDWYAIDVPAGAQIVDVVVSAVGDADDDGDVDSGVDHVVRLVAADGLTEVLGAALTDDDDDGTVSARLRTRVAGGAVTYLVVEDDDDSDSQLDATLGTYTVTLTVLANPDVNEGPGGNDDAATATALTSGAEVSAVIATQADQDLYEIAAGGGTSASNPRVLILTLETDAAISEDFQPQITIIGVDPELAPSQQSCNASCAVCDADRCKNPRLQRFVDSATFRTAYPLRDQQSVFVVVNEANDDGFQEGTGYTLRAEIVDDADPGEASDDFLIPNLEFAGFANEGDLARQYRESIERARVLTTDYLPTCEDGQEPVPVVGEPAVCLPRAAVPAPIPGIDPDATRVVDCSAAGTGPRSLTATGRLTYDGDRDYFKIEGLPEHAYFAVNLTYSATGAATTPVELALFVHNGDGRVISNTLEAEQTKSGCLSTEDDPGDDVDTGCPDGSICVDRNCWQESESNATFSNRVFPDEPDECSFISPFDEPPYVLEVVDNGINDFDGAVTYTIDIDILCGCPAECNEGGGLDTRCQGVVDPT